MKFLVDLPLGGLARWLRLCGLDAELRDLAPGPGKSQPPPVPGAVLLTRRAGLLRSGRPDLLGLTANDPEGQLGEVVQRLGLTPDDLAPLSRCGECNDRLAPLPREAALGLVPDHVFHTQPQFFQCPRCRRLFWPGSHPARITAKIEEIFRIPEKRPLHHHLSRKGAPYGL